MSKLFLHHFLFAKSLFSQEPVEYHGLCGCCVWVSNLSHWKNCKNSRPYQHAYHRSVIANSHICYDFLAVQNSPIGDLVTHSLTEGNFTFDIKEPPLKLLWNKYNDKDNPRNFTEFTKLNFKESITQKFSKN